MSLLQLRQSIPEYDVARRQAAFAEFETLGLPSRKLENWKYTPVAGLVNALENAEFFKGTVKNVLPKANFDCYQLAFVDGQLAACSNLPEGISIQSVEGLSEQEYAELFSVSYRRSHKNHHPFLALNAALFSDGVVLTVKQAVSIDKPIRIVHVNSKEQQAVFYRSLIILEENAKAEIILEYDGAENEQVNNAVFLVNLARQAKLSMVNHQQQAGQGYHLTHQIIKQQEKSQFAWLQLGDEAAWSRNELEIFLQGEQAQCQLKGLYTPKNTQYVDHQIHCEHQAPSTQSEQFYRGILSDQSKAVFNSGVKVLAGAAKADARQLNNNLLLSDQASVDTKPQLEIYHDEVTCSHGATVGQLSEDALFYMQSRGIPEMEAKRLLLDSFSYEIVKGSRYE